MSTAATTLKHKVWKTTSKISQLEKVRQPCVKVQIKNVAFQMASKNAIKLRKMA